MIAAFEDVCASSYPMRLEPFLLDVIALDYVIMIVWNRTFRSICAAIWTCDFEGQRKSTVDEIVVNFGGVKFAHVT